MKLKISLAAAFLIGGLMALPAAAGVTGTEGGEKVIIDTQTESVKRVDNVHRNDTYERSDTYQRVDNYHRNDTTTQRTQTHSPTYVIQGTVKTKHWWGGPGLEYGDAAGWRHYNANREVTIQGGRVIDDINNMIRNLKDVHDSYSTAGRTNQYTDGWDQGRTDNSNWTTYSNYAYTGRTVDNTADRTTAYQGRATTYQGRTVDTQANRTTELSSTRTREQTPNTIIVGDPDNFQNVFLAQGRVEQKTHVHSSHTDTYDHVDNYKNVDSYHNTDTYNHVDNYNRTQTNHSQATTYYQVNVTRTISPIVLDLDGDGKLQASGGKWLPHSGEFDSTRTALFDFHANGFPVLTEWVGPQDGLLVRPHADGSIDGSSLFGNAGGFRDGYDALGALDKDRNGQVDGLELQGLMVWQDGNGDAAVDDGELLALDELGITSLAVQDKDLRSTYTRNGKTLQSFDWWPTVMELRKKRVGQGT